MVKSLLNSLYTAISLADNYWVIMVIVLFFFLGVWSALTGSRLSYIIKGPAATKLFLGVQLHRASAQESKDTRGEVDAHVVDIDLAHVIFISNSSFSKGERLTMSFGKIPDFASVVEPYQITVGSCRLLRDRSGSYLVRANFSPMAPKLRLPLLAFINHLSRRHKLSLAH